MLENLYKLDRKSHPNNTVIKINDIDIGSGELVLIAGPCSVESEEQIIEIAKKVKSSGASILRGGAFKPRTSPYDFQGMQADGLKLLSLAKKEVNIPIISELVGINHIELFDDVDIIQVGARNMQNFELLKELGKIKKPVLIKRGFSNTVKEFLLSAEYIMNAGNENIILCERGIRTFEEMTRNTLDLSCVPIIKEISHLPIIVDPSHATGKSKLVPSMSLASVASGCDGLMIEVHNNPSEALSDGDQAITPEEFENICNKAKMIHKALNK